MTFSKEFYPHRYILPYITKVSTIFKEAEFAELIRFAQSLNEEQKRGVTEGLSEEELAIFDILTEPEPCLSKKEEAEVDLPVVMEKFPTLSPKH